MIYLIICSWNYCLRNIFENNKQRITHLLLFLVHFCHITWLYGFKKTFISNSYWRITFLWESFTIFLFSRESNIWNVLSDFLQDKLTDAVEDIVSFKSHKKTLGDDTEHRHRTTFPEKQRETESDRTTQTGKSRGTPAEHVEQLLHLRDREPVCSTSWTKA